MKLLITTTCCWLVLSLNAQMIGLTVEVDTAFYAPTGNGFDQEGLLNGYVSYDVYAVFANETDELSAIYSDALALGTEPFYVDAPCGCFNPLLGDVLLGASQNPGLLSFFPEIAYDTYWTLGFAPGEQIVNTNPDYSSTTMCSEQESSGSIFTIAPVEAGPDMRIQIAQVTTCGPFSLHACFQVFIEGDQGNNELWCMEGDGNGPLFVNDGEISGCTDPNASNYDSQATYSDGSCFYVVLGCTNPQACNYDLESNTDDGSCNYCFCLDGTNWNDSLQGCVITEAALAENCGQGTFWDEESQTCLVIANCAEDLNGDGVIGVDDLMQLLSVYATDCEAEDVDPELGEFNCGDPVNYQGYDYATAQIGEQCWFAENLRTAQYSNGDEVLHHPQGSSWLDAANAESGAWAHFSNDSASGVTYGKLYNWYVTVDERGICPSGWHVPENAEWSTLVNHYGGSASAAIELKGNHSEVWFGNGTDGFNALPGGFRDWGNAVFFSQGTSGDWWTSSHQGAGFWRGMDADLDNVHNALYGRAMGNSVRCLKNTE